MTTQEIQIVKNSIQRVERKLKENEYERRALGRGVLPYILIQSKIRRNASDRIQLTEELKNLNIKLNNQ